MSQLLSIRNMEAVSTTLTVSITRSLYDDFLILSTPSPLEKLDEFGFIIMSKEKRQERTKWFSMMRHRKGGATVGNTSHCRGLCKYLPFAGRGSKISFKKTGNRWCKSCERVIRCPRCRCCGNLGRSEPRARNKDLDTITRIE